MGSEMCIRDSPMVPLWNPYGSSCPWLGPWSGIAPDCLGLGPKLYNRCLAPSRIAFAMSLAHQKLFKIGKIRCLAPFFQQRSLREL